MSAATAFSGVFEETMKRVSNVSKEYSRRNQERIEVILNKHCVARAPQRCVEGGLIAEKQQYFGNKPRIYYWFRGGTLIGDKRESRVDLGESGDWSLMNFDQSNPNLTICIILGMVEWEERRVLIYLFLLRVKTVRKHTSLWKVYIMTSILKSRHKTTICQGCLHYIYQILLCKGSSW